MTVFYQQQSRLHCCQAPLRPTVHLPDSSRILLLGMWIWYVDWLLDGHEQTIAVETGTGRAVGTNPKRFVTEARIAIGGQVEAENWQCGGNITGCGHTRLP
jgi:hypothetical protein